jgi:hypothetical protein
MRTPKVLAAAMLLLAIGCKSDSTGPADTVAGNYVLATVNAGGLPAIVFQNSAGRVVILTATMLLRDDKSYVETRNYSAILITGENAPTTEVENGNYSVVGTQITFSIPASGGNAAFSYTGAVAGGALTYTYGGISYRYQKPA